MSGYKKIFLDTNPIIYRIEKNAEYFDKVSAFIEKNVNAEFATSTITVAEFFPHPIKNKDQNAITAFDTFIENMDVEIVEIDRAIAYKSAEIRASFNYKIKLMDALQLAAAVKSGCDLFLSNDNQLRQFTEIKVLTMDNI